MAKPNIENNDKQRDEEIGFDDTIKPLGLMIEIDEQNTQNEISSRNENQNSESTNQIKVVKYDSIA